MVKSKVGRNDPCPCGSGKKYKKCCMLKQDMEKQVPTIALFDAASMRMNNLLLKMKRTEFMQAYKGPSIDIEKSVMRTLSNFPSTSESEKALILWKNMLEKKLHSLCSKHSKYFWLFLSRRIFPETIEPYDLPTTPHLHRTTFNLAILKYGIINTMDEFIAVPSSVDMWQYVVSDEPYSGETVDMKKAYMVEMENEVDFKEARQPSIIPRQLNLEDAINIYQIEYLSYSYYMVTAQLRRLWKGGRMRVYQNMFANVELPKKIEGLVKLYDKRSPKYGNLLSSFGSITDLEAIKKEDNKEFLIFVPIPNIEKHDIPLVFPEEEFLNGKVKGEILPLGNPVNFVPMIVSLKPFYEKMCMFRKIVEEMFKFSPEELVSFLIALDKHSQSFWLRNIFSRYHFLQHTIKGKVNSSSSISISFNYIGGQTPASIYLAPNLAVKYGLIRL